MSKVEFDGGGFAIFKSYHDVRLPAHLIGSHISDYKQFRYAFNDFLKVIRSDRGWRHGFSTNQIAAIDEAIRTNNPRIKGFTWHHHQDHGILQLISVPEHRIFHYGGRFTTGGRKEKK